MRVEPGVVQEDLNRAAKRFGLGFGPDTSTSNRATLGGMIGNNSSGQRVDRLRHDDRPRLGARGRARRRVARHVLARARRRERFEDASTPACEAILREHARAIAEDYPKHWRQSGGYRLDRMDPFDLSKLVVGSEGTLAIVTAATVGLVELPKAKMFAVGHFDSLLRRDRRHRGRARAASRASVEMIDRTILGLSRSKLEYRRLADRLEGDPEALLFVAFAGDTDDEVRDKLDQLARAWAEHGHGYHIAARRDRRRAGRADQGPQGRARPADGRQRGPHAAGGVRRGHGGRARAARRVRRARSARSSTATGSTAGFYGHCSVGCLHIRPFLDLSRPDEVETMRAVAEEIVDLVAEFDGVNSSEHGDGRVRSPFNPRIFGDELYGAMREVKAAVRPGRTCSTPA